MIKPPALKPGDTIGIMAPSSHVEKESVFKASQWLENYGFNLKVHPQTFARKHQSAGTPEEKAAAFHELLSDHTVDIIMAARGGNRAGTMLPLLDYKLIAANPKPIIGYSDMTALLAGINRKAGLVTFHGPGLNSFTNATEEKHLELAFNIMAGFTLDLPMWGTSVLHSGTASGRLVGGNLSLICSLMGTVWEPDFEGALLFLEDVGDQMSRYDRMLFQLYNAGVFDKVKGVILGDFSAAEDKGAVPFGFTLPDILQEIFADARFPVVTGAPFGHGTSLLTMPLGVSATLKAEADHEVILRLDEPPVQG